MSYYLVKSIKDVGGFLVGTLYNLDTGDISCKLNQAWNPKLQGSIVHVWGDIGTFKGEPQIVGVAEIEENPTDDAIANCVTAAPIPADDMCSYLKGVIEDMCDVNLKQVTYNVLQANIVKFSKMPAGIRMHHSIMSGQLYHTYSMLRAAEAMTKMYYMNTDLLYAGVILHDIGKVKELDVTSAWGVSDYSQQGNALGHLLIGANIIYAEACKLGCEDEPVITALINMVASHHGTPEFGNLHVPMTIEAELLHLLDMFDCRYDMYTHAVGNGETGVVTGIGHRVMLGV